jgi:hypothetical protein
MVLGLSTFWTFAIGVGVILLLYLPVRVLGRWMQRKGRQLERRD